MIHPDWDPDKASAHLARLRDELGKLEAMHEAFSNAADEAWRDVSNRSDQITYCERMFSKPRKMATRLEDLHVVGQTMATP